MVAAGFIANEHQPDAGGYYKMFPAEPVRPSGLLQIGAIVPLKSINVFSLLTAIAKKGAKNVLIVSHGFGGGLTIPLTAKAKKPLGVDEVFNLNEYLKGSITEKETASRLEVTVGDVVQLRSAILKVRSLHIERLVMRACDAGSFPEILEGLRHLIGSATACAPNELVSFGKADPGKTASPKEFAKFIESEVVIVEGSAPNRFAWTATISDKVTLQLKAESRQGLTNWIAQHFPKGNYRGSGPFGFEALVVANRLVFPLDQEYRTHLKQVPAEKP